MRTGEFTVMPEAMRNYLRATMAVGALAIAGTPAAHAEAQPKVPAQELRETEQRLERRIETHQPVQYEANYDVLWSPPRSKYDFEYRTIAPLKAKVRGKERYFSLRQTGNSLRDIEVEALPAQSLRVQGTHTKTPQTNPNLGVPGNRRVSSTSGIIEICEHHHPELTIHYKDGGKKHIQAGRTKREHHNGPMVA